MPKEINDIDCKAAGLTRTLPAREAKRIQLKWLALAREALIRAGVESDEANGTVGWSNDHTPARGKAAAWAFDLASRLEGEEGLDSA